MIKAGETLEQAANIFAVEEVSRDSVSMHGVVAVGERVEELFSVTDMGEKPASDMAPSSLIITGRYILQPEIFDVLSEQKCGAGGEIQLTDVAYALARPDLEPALRDVLQNLLRSSSSQCSRSDKPAFKD